MRDIRVYCDTELVANNEAVLDKMPSHHLLKVLRLKVGDDVVVFNGKGGQHRGTIAHIKGSQAVFMPEQFEEVNNESPLAIHLGQGISRGERMDYVVQKSAELGIAEITPLLTERCVAKLPADRVQKRINHWQKIAIGASEQSGRCSIMRVNPPVTLQQWLAQEHPVGFVCDTVAEEGLALEQIQSVSLLIGPEGGLTQQEIEFATQQGFARLSLGPRVLRTETAPVVAATLLQYKYGDL